MRAHPAGPAGAALGLMIAACALAPPRGEPTAMLLAELQTALADFRSSSAGTARAPPQPALAPLAGVGRARLKAALGPPDGCPLRNRGAECAHAAQWRYRYFAPPPLREANGQAVVGYAYTIDLALEFAADDSIARAAWQLGR